MIGVRVARALALGSRRRTPGVGCPLGIHSLVTQMAIDSSVPFNADRKTKIVCTIGPACVNRLKDMLYSGMNVARINCAHGDAEQYADIVKKVREAEICVRQERTAGTCPTNIDGPTLSGSLCEVAAIAFDVKGPEIRTGRFGAEVPNTSIVQANLDGTVRTEVGPKEVPLKKGDLITLTTNPEMRESGTPKELFITYPKIVDQAQPGQLIYVDDGNVTLRLISKDTRKGTLLCESRTSSPIGERKNVNLPGITVDLPAVTEKDKVDIKTARDLKADFIFASFVQSADAVREIRSLAGPHIRIISKIESQEGIDNYDEILSASDGIMVARGDLGVQIPGERVFLAQKMMVAKANIAGKIVICATQMLDSMVHNSRPTRAEIVDVSSAVLDGADAVMLSGETAKGKYPLESVATMSRCCQAAEKIFSYREFFSELVSNELTPIDVEDDEALMYHETEMKSHQKAHSEFMTSADVETLASSTVHAAFEARAKAIVVLSRLSGRSAALVSKYRPACPILCLTTEEKVARQMQMRRGIQCVLVPQGLSNDKTREMALDILSMYGIGEPGDTIVMMHGKGETQGTFGAGMMVYLQRL